MDHLQRQPCHKIYNYYEDENISLNEMCDNVLSMSELNRFEQSVLTFNGRADNLYLYERDDIEDGESKPQQQINSQLNEENLNFKLLNTSNENAVFNSSFESPINAMQQENHPDDLILDCGITAKLNASEAKGEEIVDYSITTVMSESLDDSQSMIRKSLSTNFSSSHYIHKITSTLYTQKETKSVKLSSHELKEGCTETSNRDAILNSRMAESFDDVNKEKFLHFSNASLSKQTSENFELIYGQKCDENREVRQNQNSSGKDSEVCHERENEFSNNYEPFLPENGAHHVAGTSGMSAEGQRHHRKKSFVCPFCGKGFRCRAELVIHNRHRTGEKPYTCEKCGKMFAAKNKLNRHMMIHTGEKSFACHICERSFLLKESLTRHVLTHSGEKPYKCFICAKAYKHQWSLERHQMSAHNRKIKRKVCKEILNH